MTNPHVGCIFFIRQIIRKYRQWGEILKQLNLYAAWIGILAGFIDGAIIGLFFHSEDWLEGYNSWKRRLLRLGHVSFFGIALINLAFAFSVDHLGITGSVQTSSYLFVVAAVTMPLICIVSAFKKSFRHLFFIPVLSLVIATVLFIYKGFII